MTGEQDALRRWSAEVAEAQAGPTEMRLIQAGGPVDRVGDAILQYAEKLGLLSFRQLPADTASSSFFFASAYSALTRPSTDLPCAVAT